MNRQMSKIAQALIEEHLCKYPDETYKHLAKRFGFSYGQVVHLVRKAGLCKRNKRWEDPSEGGEWVFIPQERETNQGG